MSIASTKTIYQRIADASALIGHIDKGGFNAHFKFKYQAWDDVVPALQSACIVSGLWLIPSMELISHEGGHAVIKLDLTVVDQETERSIQVQWVGEAKGTDDKGIQKAATSAYKYLALKLFQIPTVGVVDDPDAGNGQSKPNPVEQPTKKEPTEEQKIVKDWLDSLEMDKDQRKALAEKMKKMKVDPTATSLIMKGQNVCNFAEAMAWLEESEAKGK